MKKRNLKNNFSDVVKPEPSMKENHAYTEAKPFIPVEEKPKWYQRKKRKEWKKNNHLLKAKRDKVVLVKMEMNNGRFREFLIEEDFGSFIFNQGRYVFDLEQKYYIIDRNIWAYDFHESLTLPIRRKMVVSDPVEKFLKSIEEKGKHPINPHVEINEIKKLVENSDLIDVESSLNPVTLKRFTDSEVIKQVLQGAMLGKIFKIMFIVIIIIGVLVLMIFFIDLYHSGIFEKISHTLKKD